MVKVVLVGIAAMFLALVAGSFKREYAILTAIGGAFVIFSYGLSKVSLIAEEVRALQDIIGLDSQYVTILLKMVGIAYLTQFAVSLCRDAGHGAIAGQIGFAGKISMLLVSLPVLKMLMQMIGELFV